MYLLNLTDFTQIFYVGHVISAKSCFGELVLFRSILADY